MAATLKLRSLAISLIVAGGLLLMITLALSVIRMLSPELLSSHKSPTAQQIIERGYLRCEISNQLPGLAARTSWAESETDRLRPEDTGSDYYFDATGLEADFCRAIAIALLNDQNAVAFRTSKQKQQQRMSALSLGEIDVMFSSTVFQSMEDAANSINYGPAYYFEPMVLMTEIDSDNANNSFADQRFRSLRVCTTRSTHPAAVAQRFSGKYQLQWQLVSAIDENQPFRNYVQAVVAYENNACDAVVGRHSVLQKYIRKNPSDNKLINRSKLIPLGLNYVSPHVVVVSNKDEHWEDIVSHAIWSTMDADARGFSSDSKNLYQRHVLWNSLGLDPANAGNLIKTLGNYREIYQRNLAGHSPDSGANRHYLIDERGMLIVPR